MRLYTHVNSVYFETNSFLNMGSNPNEKPFLNCRKAKKIHPTLFLFPQSCSVKTQQRSTASNDGNDVPVLVGRKLTFA